MRAKRNKKGAVIFIPIGSKCINKIVTTKKILMKLFFLFLYKYINGKLNLTQSTM